MKIKTKLALEQLEKELSKLSIQELNCILGGNSTGNNNNSSIEEIVNYFSQKGLNFTQDSSGNYFYNDSIMIEPITVIGYTSTGTGANSMWYSTGSGIEALYINNFIDNGLTGYSTGGGSGGGGISQMPSSAVEEIWKRDGSGIIESETTLSPPFVYNVYGDNLVVQEHVLVTKFGALIKAYKVLGVGTVENNGNVTITKSATDTQTSNCIGYAITGGQFLFIDNPSTPSSDEGKITHSFFLQWSGYEECTKDESELVFLYGIGVIGGASHAGIISNGLYSAKGGGGEFYIKTGMTESEFYQPYSHLPGGGPDYNGNDDQVLTVYYRKKN